MGSRPPDDALARLARWDELRRRAAGGRDAAEPGPAVDPSAVVDDVTRTIRNLTDRHPSLSLAVVAEDAGALWRLHITGTGGEVQVVLDTGNAPDPPAGAAEPAASTAAQLAELLREHPEIVDERG